MRRAAPDARVKMADRSLVVKSRTKSYLPRRTLLNNSTSFFQRFELPAGNVPAKTSSTLGSFSKIVSVPPLTHALIRASGNARRNPAKTGVANKTSPINRSLITRIRHGLNRSPLTRYSAPANVRVSIYPTNLQLGPLLSRAQIGA